MGPAYQPNCMSKSLDSTSSPGYPWLPGPFFITAHQVLFIFFLTKDETWIKVCFNSLSWHIWNIENRQSFALKQYLVSADLCSSCSSWENKSNLVCTTLQLNTIPCQLHLAWIYNFSCNQQEPSQGPFLGRKNGKIKAQWPKMHFWSTVPAGWKWWFRSKYIKIIKKKKKPTSKHRRNKAISNGRYQDTKGGKINQKPDNLSYVIDGAMQALIKAKYGFS